MCGGDDGTQTRNLCYAIVALYHSSYAPTAFLILPDTGARQEPLRRRNI